jgi:FkbM family methyltransferase
MNWKYAFEKYSNKLIDIYVILFGRPIFKRFNLFLFNLSQRGLGINNITRGIPFFNSEYFEGEIKLLKKITKFFNFHKYIYIDVGANDGSHVNNLIKSYKKINFCLFEANPFNYKKLRQNIKKNKKIRLYNFALGRKNALIKMFDYKRSGSKLSTSNKKNLKYLVNKKIYSFNVEVKKLDNFNFIKKVKIIKIDVEGDELNVLLGAKKLINKFNPIIILEFNSCHIFSRTFLRDILNVLKYYKVYRILPRGKIISLSDKYSASEYEIFSYQNLLFLPKKENEKILKILN